MFLILLNSLSKPIYMQKIVEIGPPIKNRNPNFKNILQSNRDFTQHAAN